MDAHSWTKREDRFAKAFKIAKRNIPKLFEAFELPPLRQIALIAYGGKGTRETLGGGELLMLGEFVKQIQLNLRDKRVDGDAVPEQFPIIRGIQFAIHYGMTLNWAE